jgi:Protein of unknown function (DUF3122)
MNSFPKPLLKTKPPQQNSFFDPPISHCLDHRIRRLILFIGFFVFFGCSSLTICSPAAALLREHHESPGVLRYHAQTSLKDKQGYTWQVVLFPQPVSSNVVTSELARGVQFNGSEPVAKYHLRLVGFPGIAEFIHPQPLEIITPRGQVLNAVDLIATPSAALNVGEFDLTNILPILAEKGSLKLSIILRGDRDLSLSIPESTIIEWKWLTVMD